MSTPSPRPTAAYALRRPSFPRTFPYPPSAFTRADPTPDPAFYASPRFVQHIDDRCRAALSQYYASVLPRPVSVSTQAEGGAQPEDGKVRAPRILDLCSSWTSHLPSSYAPPGAYVAGLGMSPQELERNPLLSGRVVHDLNADPGLPLVLTSAGAIAGAGAGTGAGVGGGGGEEAGGGGGAEEGYDAVICSVSVDYLTRPLEVFRELARVTRRGGTAHMGFSNRCFPTKVVRRWLEVGEEERCDMVASYFHFAGTSEGEGGCEPGQLWEEVEVVTVLEKGWVGDPLWVVRARRTGVGVPQ